MNATSHPLTDLTQHISGHIDVFICSASFEARSLSIAEHLDPQGIAKIVIAKNVAFADAVRYNDERLHRLFDGKAVPLLVNAHNPISSADEIVKIVRECRLESNQRIVIDITTFTHESLLVLFKVCNFSFKRHDVIDFVYAPASDYSIGDEPDKKWLSKGIREVRSVLGYSGELVPSRGTHLIILGGFEDYRALELIREVEPALISIGYGDRTEHSTRPHQETNEKKVSRLRSVVADVNTFVFSCYDAQSTEETLRTVTATGGSLNTIIAPMNTKISTLGAARFAIKNEKVQLCYAQAELYNYKNYSRPGTDFYHFRFDDYPLLFMTAT